MQVYAGTSTGIHIGHALWSVRAIPDGKHLRDHTNVAFVRYAPKILRDISLSPFEVKGTTCLSSHTRANPEAMR